jgi:methanogenic corrinoid protein MtbC1
MDNLNRIKSDAGKLPTISEGAISAFSHSLPRLLFLVNEKFVVENRFCCGRSLEKQMDLLRSVHKNFGEVLLAVYQFGLYDALVDEFAWLVSMLWYRDIRKEYLEKMFAAWIVALHGTVQPSFSRQLAEPLRFLEKNLSAFLKEAEISIPMGDKDQKEFVTLLLSKQRRDSADFMISRLRSSKEPDQLCNLVLMPALREIGLLWQTNQICSADEHVATEICRYVIFRLCDALPREKSLSYKALVSCVPGEEHQLGAEMVAGYLEGKGWTVCYLGRSLPEEDEMAAIAKYQPEVVFLSCSLIANLPATVSLLGKIRQASPRIKIVAGGHAAVAAQEKIQNWAEVVVADYQEVHLAALRLLEKNA